MPCYTVRKITQEFKAKHLDVLRQALEALKLDYRQVGSQISVAAGTITIDTDLGTAQFSPAYQGTVNKIKQQYTLKALQAAGKVKGWAVQVNPMNQNRVTVTKF